MFLLPFNKIFLFLEKVFIYLLYFEADKKLGMSKVKIFQKLFLESFFFFESHQKQFIRHSWRSLSASIILLLIRNTNVSKL